MPLARLEIDVGAAQRNLRAVARASGRPAVCVVKADAYGHGALRIARALETEEACRGFAVARMEEAVELRPGLETDQPILCFGTFLAARRETERRQVLTACRELDVDLVLASVDDTSALLSVPPRLRRGVRAHLAVDTGMTREGVGIDALAETCARLTAGGVELLSIWTHFASSEEPDGSASVAQLEAFARAVGDVAVPPVPVHLENSAAALHGVGDRLPAALRRRIMATRVGGALFGLDLRRGNDAPRLEPVMRVATRLVQVRRVERGTAIGYGGTWVAPRDSAIGLAAVGYADGLRIPAPALLWQGRERSARVPVVGRVSMDLITVDCTEAMDASGGPEVGDELIVLGSSRSLTVDARAHAEAAGVVDYAVTVGFSLRLPRHRGDSPSQPGLPGGSVI